MRAEDVLSTIYDAVIAFKATLPRLVPAGDIGDTEVYGAQQHGPLLDVDSDLSGLSPCLDRPNRAKNQLHTRNRLTQGR